MDTIMYLTCVRNTWTHSCIWHACEAYMNIHATRRGHYLVLKWYVVRHTLLFPCTVPHPSITLNVSCLSWMKLTKQILIADVLSMLNAWARTSMRTFFYTQSHTMSRLSSKRQAKAVAGASNTVSKTASERIWIMLANPAIFSTTTCHPHQEENLRTASEWRFRLDAAKIDHTTTRVDYEPAYAIHQMVGKIICNDPWKWI